MFADKNKKQRTTPHYSKPVCGRCTRRDRRFRVRKLYSRCTGNAGNGGDAGGTLNIIPSDSASSISVNVASMKPENTGEGISILYDFTNTMHVSPSGTSNTDSTSVSFNCMLVASGTGLPFNFCNRLDLVFFEGSNVSVPSALTLSVA